MATQTFPSTTFDGTHTTTLGSMTTAVVLPKTYSDITEFTGHWLLWNPTFTDPVKLRYFITDYQGVRYGELEAASVESIDWTLNDMGTLDFELTVTDPKVLLCQPISREIQVVRGKQVIWWGPITRISNGKGVYQYQATDCIWYLTRRVLGQVPQPNYLTNSTFQDDLTGWTFTSLSGGKPNTPPTHALTTDSVTGPIFQNGIQVPGRALKLDGNVINVETTRTTILISSLFKSASSSVLTTTGKKKLASYANGLNPATTTLVIEGHGATGTTAGVPLAQANAAKTYILTKKPTLTITTVDKAQTVPVATNKTTTGRKKNQRLVLAKTITSSLASEMRQVAKQSFTITNPKTAAALEVTCVGWYKVLSSGWSDTNKDKRAMSMSMVTGTEAETTQSIPLESTVSKDMWSAGIISLSVPADGKTYTITVCLYAAAGSVIWDEVTATAQESMVFDGVDQALIVKALVEHAQNAAIGKPSLNIGTNCQPTGVKWIEEPDVKTRPTVYDKIMAYPALVNGVDIGMEYTATTRTLTTYFPRKGGAWAQGILNSPVLEYGANILSYTGAWDGLDAANRVIVLAPDDNSGNVYTSEGVATDDDSFGGIILEKAYQAVGTTLDSLPYQAMRAVRRYSRPDIVPTLVSRPDRIDELMEQITTGTVVRVEINDGQLVVNDFFRVAGMSLDPRTNQITFTLAPEYQ